jgi:hypothetical protein
VELDNPDVIMIQETMGKGDPLVLELKKMFGGWDFYGLDSDGFSGGIITRFNKNITLVNYFVVCSSLCTVVHNKSLGHSLTLLNVYGPYEGRKWFWDNLFSLNCF